MFIVVKPYFYTKITFLIYGYVARYNRTDTISVRRVVSAGVMCIVLRVAHDGQYEARYMSHSLITIFCSNTI